MLTDKSKDEDSFIEKIFNDIVTPKNKENNSISNTIINSKSISKSNSISNSVSNSIEIESTTTKDDAKENDQQFECYLRNSLENNLKLEKIQDEKLKEFEIFKIKLFDVKKKKLISTKSFYCDRKYYWINDKDKYFIIKKGDFSTLYYCDNKTKEYKIIRGIDETKHNDAKIILHKKENEPVPKTEQKDDAQLNHVKENNDIKIETVPKNEQKNDKLIPSKSCDDKKESVPKKEEEEEFKLIIEENKTADKKEPVPEDVEDDVFLHEMKFNLLSKKTVSIVGENNNIPP